MVILLEPVMKFCFFRAMEPHRSKIANQLNSVLIISRNCSEQENTGELTADFIKSKKYLYIM